MAQFSPIYGKIASITPAYGSGGCTLLFSLNSQDFGPVNLTVSNETYVLEQETFEPGDSIIAFYDTTAPVPLIYPPQYSAFVMLEQEDNQFAAFDYFNEELVNSDQTLKLNLQGQMAKNILLPNGQIFTGNPGGHYLLVIYSTTTRSIPAQTTPKEVIVFC